MNKKTGKPGDYVLQFGAKIGTCIKDCPVEYLMYLATDLKVTSKKHARAKKRASLHLEKIWKKGP